MNVTSDQAHRWVSGERPLQASSPADVLAFRRESAPQHYGELSGRQATCRDQIAAFLRRNYPDLDPDQLSDVLWRALDRVIEDSRIITGGGG